jgi:hypothetical protein
LVIWFIKLRARQNYWSFPSQGILNKDLTIWLDGARPPPISPIMSLTNSKFDELGMEKMKCSGYGPRAIKGIALNPVCKYSIVINLIWTCELLVLFDPQAF